VTAEIPSLSLVIPVVGGDAGSSVEATIGSALGQTGTDWELLIVADEASRRRVQDTLATAANPVPCAVLQCPGDRFSALGRGIEAARGTFVTWIDPGDRLAAEALELLMAAIDDEVDFVYSDEDEVDEGGSVRCSYYKPDWSPERLRCLHYTGRLSAYRRRLLNAAGGLRTEVRNAEDYDVALRFSEKARRIAHLPQVLVHRPLGTTSGYAPGSDAALRVIAEHLDRVGFPATVERDTERPQLCRLVPALHEAPLVSIVIPTGGGRRRLRGATVNLAANCIASIVTESTYAHYEIVCVVDDSIAPRAVEEIVEAGRDRLRLVPYGGAFNFAHKVNIGSLHARGDYLLLLNDDTQVITPEWIESLLTFATDERVGAVGAKLRFGDRRLQHVGVVAVDGNPGHPYYGFPQDYDGYAANARTPANYVAVTAACLMIRKRYFDAVGGLSLDFGLNYNDVDFCLKLGHMGYRTVFDPFAELYHFESSSRTGEVADEELSALRARWGRVLYCDPYYNPNFGATANFVEPFTLEQPIV
jgi:O-antigen biosynthesis protein